MKRSIFVDIDGTLANIKHRVHHIETAPDGSVNKDWDAFYADAAHDTMIVPTIQLVQGLKAAGWFIILITGRDAAWRILTETWLCQKGVHFDLMLMRPPGDHRPDVEIKRDWLNRMRNGEMAMLGVGVPAIVIEDRKKVVDMWREEGLIALQCDEGDF